MLCLIAHKYSFTSFSSQLAKCHGGRISFHPSNMMPFNHLYTSCGRRISAYSCFSYPPLSPVGLSQKLISYVPPSTWYSGSVWGPQLPVPSPRWAASSLTYTESADILMSSTWRALNSSTSVQRDTLNWISFPDAAMNNPFFLAIIFPRFVTGLPSAFFSCSPVAGSVRCLYSKQQQLG